MVEDSHVSSEGTMIEHRGGSGGQKQMLSAAQKKHMRTGMAFADVFAHIDHKMPIQYMRAFLAVAQEEGLTLKDYRRRLGLSQSVMSRHISDIGERDRYGGAGYDLVYTKTNLLDRREHFVFLTPKGVAIANELIRALER